MYHTTWLSEGRNVLQNQSLGRKTVLKTAIAVSSVAVDIAFLFGGGTRSERKAPLFQGGWEVFW
jgi:hypothetical protein